MSYWIKCIGLLFLSAALVTGCDFLDDDDDASNDGNATNVNNTNNNDNNDGDNDGDNDEELAGGWYGYELDVPDGVARHDVRVTGIHCESADECAVSTYVPLDHGFIVGATTSGSTGVVYNGETLSDELAGTDFRFHGFNQTSLGLHARLSASYRFVLGDGDLTDPASWDNIRPGTNDSESDFSVLNDQWLLADDGNDNWVFHYRGVMFRTDEEPSEITHWAGVWAPNRNPPYPNDHADRKSADDTLCDSSPEISISPTTTQYSEAASDLSWIMITANALDQRGSDPSGVCVSEDMGDNFYQVPFPDANNDDNYGPQAVYCIDDDHCWAYGGRTFADDSAMIYYTTNASDGRDMDWSRGTLPDGLPDDGVVPKHVFFAPDAQHGWMTGNVKNDTMLFQTTDGGATWEDISNGLRAASGGTRMHAGFALDENRIFIGGEDDVLYYHENSGLTD